MTARAFFAHSALTLLATLLISLAPELRAAPKACPALLNHTFARLQDDAPQSLCQYAGKVILVVNTASFCGFTSQYEGLEKLYADKKESGLVILGFPSNDFGNQEPGTSKQIAEFCTNTYGVKFPMFAKSSVSRANPNPLFAELGRATEFPRWNFHKYLIDREGRLIKSYSSVTSPSDRSIQQDIDRALKARPPA